MGVFNLDLRDENERDVLSNVSYFKGDEKPSFGTTLAAKFASSATYSPTNMAVRFAKEQYAKFTGGPELSVEELNKLYPALGPDSKFDTPMNKEQADIIYRYSMQKREADKIIAEGSSEESAFETAIGFGVSMLPHVVDPISWALAAGFEAGAVGLLGSKMASGGAASSFMLKATEAGAKLSTAGRVAEGLTTGAIIEGATFGMSELENQEYDAETTLKYAIVGAVAPPVFLGQAAKVWGKFKGKIGRAVGLAESKLNKGELPDTKPMLDSLEGKIDPEVDGPKIREEYNKKYDNLVEADTRNLDSDVQARELEVKEQDRVFEESKLEIAKLKEAGEIPDIAADDLAKAEIEIAKAEKIKNLYEDLKLCSGG